MVDRVTGNGNNRRGNPPSSGPMSQTEPDELCSRPRGVRPLHGSLLSSSRSADGFLCPRGRSSARARRRLRTWGAHDRARPPVGPGQRDCRRPIRAVRQRSSRAPARGHGRSNICGTSAVSGPILRRGHRPIGRPFHGRSGRRVGGDGACNAPAGRGRSLRLGSRRRTRAARHVLGSGARTRPRGQ